MFDKVEPLPIFKVMRIVRDARSTSGSQRLVLWALSLRCSPKRGYTAFPSYATLGKDTGLDPHTCKRAARALEEASLIQRIRRRNRANVFRLNVALLLDQMDAQLKADELSKVDDLDALLADETGSGDLHDNDAASRGSSGWNKSRGGRG